MLVGLFLGCWYFLQCFRIIILIVGLLSLGVLWDWFVALCFPVYYLLVGLGSLLRVDLWSRCLLICLVTCLT